MATAPLFSDVKGIAEQIIRAKIDPFISQFKAAKRKIGNLDADGIAQDMVDTAKDAMMNKLNEINELFVQVSEAVVGLSAIPKDLISTVASAGTIMPPGSATPVVVSQITANKRGWEAQAGDAKAKVSTLNQSLGQLSEGIDLGSLNAAKDTVADLTKPIEDISTALAAIPL